MLSLALLALTLGAPNGLEDSVVQVQVYSARYDYNAPWRILPVRAGSGTGFLIDGGRIVTNAHVVRDAKQVLIKRHNVANPFIARVEAVADDCDLAVLRVDDRRFHDGLTALRIGRGLPKRKSKVTTYGYPAGGQELSSTTGIVSRVEWLTYVQSGADAHMAIQTDAAINPGNSGGPVIQNGKIVGVAFQGAPHLQNVGFFIPVPILRHFLTNLEDGRYDGFPDAGAQETKLLSPAYRAERKLPEKETGVVIEAVAPGGTIGSVLRAGDVLLAVDGIDVADDGSVSLGEVRGPYNHLLDMKQVGEQVRFTVWRDGRRQTLSTPARRVARFDRQRYQWGKAPRFVLYAGLVFMPLDLEYLRTFGKDWPGKVPRSMAWYHFFQEWEEPKAADEEVVVLAKVLPDATNADLSIEYGVLEKVGGRRIRGLQALDDAFTAARLQGKGYLEFEFADGVVEVLDIEAAERAHPRILETYGVQNAKNL